MLDSLGEWNFCGPNIFGDYLQALFRYKVCLILVTDILGGLLVTGEGGGEKECHLLRYEVWLYAVAPVYSTWTLNVSYGSVKKEITDLLQSSLHQSFSNLNVHGKQLGTH